MKSNDSFIDLNIIRKNITNYNKGIIGRENFKEAAVMILLVNYKGKINILFEVRSKKMNSNPGDICLPGGKIEKNEKPLESAIREVYEELKIEERNIKILGEIDTLIRYDGLIIYPFVAEASDISSIKINIEEVLTYFFVPLDFFVCTVPKKYSSNIVAKRPEDFPYSKINRGVNYKFPEGKYNSLFYEYEDKVIWGITAAIINDFIEILKY